MIEITREAPPTHSLGAAPLPSLNQLWRHELHGLASGMTAMHLIAYDATRFDASAFAAHGIDCPASVARSVRKRQSEFFFGRLAARLALSELGWPQANIPIGPSREPLWPAGVVGSISHTHTYAAAVALRPGTHRGIGIDIEHLVDDESRAAIIATALCEEELAHLHSLSHGLPLNTALTLVFSAKESLFKGAYAEVGRYFGFEAARLSHIDLEQRRLSFTLTESLSPALPRGHVCDLHFDFLRADLVLTSYLA